MDEKTFIKKDMELLYRIREYQDDSERKKIEIAMNDHEIGKLDYERKELYANYHLCLCS